MARLTKDGVKTATIVVVFLAFAFAVVKLSSSYLTYNSSNSTKSCHITGVSHQVVIEHNKVIPKHTVASRCDTLTITNKDNIARLVGFGVHENHVPYDGVAQRGLSKGQSLTVTLVDTGEYHFHDHIHDEVQGDFTVTPN